MGVAIVEPQLVAFEQALASSVGQRRHLFLGNGFSRACRNDIFAYDALFDRADFTALSPMARTAFEVLGTKDFELVMRSLRTAADLVTLYKADQRELCETLRDHANGLREILASAIAQNHPGHPADIEDPAYTRCKEFLSNFNHIYTVNYDLLLYWALMHTELQPHVLCDDGFRAPDDGATEYVTWDVEKTDRQNVFYLHGALHLYDSGSELKKFTWIGTGVRLIEQVRAALNEGMFPLIVAEGTSNEKMARIMHSNYLGRAYRSFAKISGSLFVFGHAMSESDEHWARLIEKGNLRKLFVGVHGELASPANTRLVERSQRISAARPQRRTLELTFFNSQTANVWG